MDSDVYLILTSIVALIILAFLWIKQYGLFFGSSASLCRILWVSPFLLSFTPKQDYRELPRSIQTTPINVLLDDSHSMKEASPLQTSFYKQANTIIQNLEQDCQDYACRLKISRLSDLNQLTTTGYTPLASTLFSWLNQHESESWMLLSDGGDSKPGAPWAPSLQDKGKPKLSSTHPRGMIVGFNSEDRDNIWIDSVNLPPFSFENKAISGEIEIRRHEDKTNEETVQVQILLKKKVVSTVNATFYDKHDYAKTAINIPKLNRGNHYFEIKVLPGLKEHTIWDNSHYQQIEVLPNTMGVLHLLGSPSWDGRFLRRHLKSEPKFDLISFYILRDPWDTQQINERELSLIPFPVARLFNEELPNFRVIVLQNFNLLQFLQPEYQRNLVKFVKNGGGLFFIGGHRALKESDIHNSPLKEILPFSLKRNFSFRAKNNPGINNPLSQAGLSYDKNLAFEIKLAEPDMHARTLASVYDEIELLKTPLESFQFGKGIHRLEQAQFIKQHTPLLNAIDQRTKKTIPLAVASYPGKGRAVWLFTDSLWKLALIPQQETSRTIYQRFIQANLTWLLREDYKKPLMIKNFNLSRIDETTQWSAQLQGPAVRYFRKNAAWHLKVCGKTNLLATATLTPLGNQKLRLSGSFTGKNPLQSCSLQIRGKHAAFGSASASATSYLPTMIPDSKLSSSPQKLQQLQDLTRADFLNPSSKQQGRLRSWLRAQTLNQDLDLKPRRESFSSHFWLINTPWIWLLLIFMPIEVIVRRWTSIIPPR